MREMEGVHKQDMRKICIVIGGDYSWNALQKEFSAHEDKRIWEDVSHQSEILYLLWFLI